MTTDPVSGGGGSRNKHGVTGYYKEHTMEKSTVLDRKRETETEMISGAFLTCLDSSVCTHVFR